ncbi:MAG: geopeptide radical SAM maturase [Desulfobulbaceae bacterium]|nr:geopeptide radical SAM maturase [Desulfobulbaceae bacterium]
MHLSRYLKFFSFPPDPEYRLLFCTKNSAMALLPEVDCRRLQSGVIPEEYAETLAKLGMVTADPETERREVFTLLDEVNRVDTGLNVSIIPGLACNFACRYCYEGSMKDGRAMGQDTVNQVVSFLKQRYASRGKDRLNLDFYGGEPLLYTGTIKNIATPLKQFVEERGGVFHFSLVTNGSLLTRDAVTELLPAGLYAAKVTVDGPADEHNRLRPFASGKPSFATILANISACADLIRIGFGGNYTSENFPRIPELLDSLSRYGLSPDNLSNVQFHPVMQTTDRYSNPEFTGGCLSVDEPWVADASIAVRREVLQRGYRVPKISPSPCMVDMEDAFVINHDGSLDKCVAMIGHGAYAAGNVWSGFTASNKVYHPGRWQERQECRECAYLPLCFGGCRHMDFQRTGTMNTINCMKTYFDRTLEETVRQDACFQAESE